MRISLPFIGKILFPVISLYLYDYISEDLVLKI